ncbi:hypothetical protein EJ03DRAFT_356001 [Teratosphaeria nubilosa]|uniref:Uncharacterized protein n=1 Tax=Teratosphaeria nubilosa TaxID=161662 RepID=A0A6G1KUV9_9PEZI|nr:hypothetical protein EJ03DRAFT_356001 [Teratosphaeria nubilosa]
MTSRAAIGVQQTRTPKAAPVRRIGGLPAEITTSSDIDSDEDDEDSSDDDTEDDDEADVVALSVAQSNGGNTAQKRLAGPANEAMYLEHDAQAKAGASEDSEDDEDAYAGVEDISDDEASVEGDKKKKKNIRLAAEQDLRAEFEGLEQEKTADAMTTGMDDMFLQDDDPFSPQHNMYSNGNLLDRLHDPLDLNLDPYCGLPMDSTVYQEMSNEAEELFMERRGSEDSINGRKKVRFIVPQPDATLSRSSSIGSNEEEQDPNELFPDLFDTHDGMANPGLNVEMFQHDFNDLESCYDFEGDGTLALDDEEEARDSEDDDQSDFDDSEDGGDTTDEEDEEEHIARMQERRKAAGRSPLLAPTTPTPKKTPTRVKIATPASNPRTGKGPRIGTFAIDKTRATMSVDVGNKMKILPPTKPTEKDRAFWARMRSANSSRSSTPRSSVSCSVQTPGPSSMMPRPLTAQSTLATMFDGNLDVLNGVSPTGLDELFGLPPRAQTSFTEAMAAADSDEEMEEQLNIHDFIQMDDSDDDSDGAEDSVLASPIQSEVFDPFRPASSHGVSGGLLDHLEQQRGLVGSFRRNQNFAKHVSSLPSNPNRRAALSELNALQKGRRSAGNTPITPARKNRNSQELTGAGVRKATASPLTARRPRSRGNSLSSAALQQTLGPDLEMRQ